MHKTFVRLVKFVVHKNNNCLGSLTTNLTNLTNKECVSHSSDLLYSWFNKNNNRFVVLTTNLTNHTNLDCVRQSLDSLGS